MSKDNQIRKREREKEKEKKKNPVNIYQTRIDEETKR